MVICPFLLRRRRRLPLLFQRIRQGDEFPLLLLSRCLPRLLHLEQLAPALALRLFLAAVTLVAILTAVCSRGALLVRRTGHRQCQYTPPRQTDKTWLTGDTRQQAVVQSLVPSIATATDGSDSSSSSLGRGLQTTSTCISNSSSSMRFAVLLSPIYTRVTTTMVLRCINQPMAYRAALIDRHPPCPRLQ